VLRSSTDPDWPDSRIGAARPAPGILRPVPEQPPPSRDAALPAPPTVHRHSRRRPTVEQPRGGDREEPFHFHRLFTRRFGQMLLMVAAMQVEHAKALMARGAALKDVVAARCGFPHHPHFTARFKHRRRLFAPPRL
jgi:hypothetical protein